MSQHVIEIIEALSSTIFCVAGVSAYILIVVMNKRTKMHGMPLWPLAFNITGELLYSIAEIVYGSKYGNDSPVDGTFKLSLFINIIGFVIDVLILIQYFKYSAKFGPKSSSKYRIQGTILVLIICMVVNIGLFYELDGGGTGSKATVVSAYLDSVMISAFYVAFAFDKEQLRCQSLGTVILRIIGVFMPVIFNGIILPPQHYEGVIITCGCSCLALDITYAIMLCRNQRLKYHKILNFTRLEKIENRRASPNKTFGHK